MENLPHMGDRIRFLRKKNNLTQDELAHKVGTTDTHVSKWESGKGVRRDYLIKLAKELGTTLDYLKYGQEPDSGHFLVDEEQKVYELANQLKSDSSAQPSQDDLFRMLEVAESLIRSAKELLKKKND